MSDLNGAFQAVFDEANRRLRITVVEAAPGPITLQMPDANGITAALQGNALRVVVA